MESDTQRSLPFSLRVLYYFQAEDLGFSDIGMEFRRSN